MSALPSDRFQGLQHLPREARDTLFLLLVVAWILLPLVHILPPWCSALTALTLAGRAWLALSGRGLPSRAWLLVLLTLASGATYASHHTLMGRDAGVNLLVLLLALKTLEMRARRDAFVVFFLGFFTMLSNFLFSQSLATAASMVIGLLGLLTALVNHHMPVGRPPLLQSARTAATMALLGAPIMVLLFVLFPRIAPLWSMPQDNGQGRSGLGSHMEVGSIASLALDSSVAMRIRFEGPVPARNQLYFRGPVLTHFDGRDWSASRPDVGANRASAGTLQVSGPPLNYEMTLEPSQQPWLPLLDVSPEPPGMEGMQAHRGAELQWRLESPQRSLLRLRAQAYTHFRHGPLQAEPGLRELLQLPPGYNPRTQALARQMRADPALQGADHAALVEAVLQRLRSGGYGYTLEPGLYGDNSADEFWFDRKQGFCEHIASAFVLLMRALQVPARVVTGYQGGDLNSVDGYWTVRQSDAHAWAEVWVAGQGWLRVDPTAAVAPGRTGTLQRLVPPRSLVAQALGSISPGFEIDLRALWEAGNNRWNQWVLNYAQSNQLELLRNLGFASPEWEDLGYVLIACLIVASLSAAAWAHASRTRVDPWLRLLQAASRRLQRAGLAVPPNTPPRRLAQALPPELAPIARWLLQMEAWRYAPDLPHRKGDEPGLGTLRRQYRQLHWPRSLPPCAAPPPP